MNKSRLWICEVLIWSALALPGAALALDSPPDSTSSTPLTDDYVPASHATSWGFQFDGTFSAFGGEPIATSTTEYDVRGVTLQLEYLLPLAERMGKLGVGINYGAYPVSASAGLTSGPFSVSQLGLQARYQFKYFDHQWVVPVAALMLNRLSYEFSFATAESSMMLTGFSGGLWIYLNPWEPTAAADMETDAGISRTYLTAEARMLSGENTDLAISGASYFFGLRFEM